jgi:MFS family permease
MALWGHRDFLLLWSAETVSEVGTMVTRLALPLLAATVLGATPWEMGLLAAATTAAFLLVGLPAGALLDRVPRRPVMIAADLVRFVLFGWIPLAWWLGVLTFWQVLLVALLGGVATVFFDVGYQSILPSVVGGRAWSRATPSSSPPGPVRRPPGRRWAARSCRWSARRARCWWTR